MRGGHRSAAEILIEVARLARQGVDARGAEVHRRRAKAGEGSELVGVVGCRNRQDVIGVIARGVVRRSVVVGRAVARSRDEEDVVRPALLISSRRACENPPPPQLLLSTRTLTPAIFALTEKSIALIASAVVPLPTESRNLRPMIEVVQFTPTTPSALLPAAPMVPETCVP